MNKEELARLMAESVKTGVKAGLHESGKKTQWIQPLATVFVALIAVSGTFYLASNTFKGVLKNTETQLEITKQTEANKLTLEKMGQLEKLFFDITDGADHADDMTIKAKIEALGVGGKDAVDHLIMLRNFYRNRNNAVIEDHIDKTLKRILFSTGRDLSQMQFSRKDRQTNALIGRGSLLKQNFANYNLTGADFDGCNLNGSDFSGSILIGSSFEGAILVDTNFQAADLTGASFEQHASQSAWKTDVRGADFRGAVLKQVSFKGVANLEVATFAPPDLVAFSRQRVQQQGPFAGVSETVLSALYKAHEEKLMEMANKDLNFHQSLKESPIWSALNRSIKKSQ
jgi:uncharacterized protein YjbI with pentapeptide repeats